MSIKGFSTQKKELNIAGYPDVKDTAQFITGQQTQSDKVGLDVINNAAFRVSSLLTAEAGSTNIVLKCTSHGALLHDFIRFEETTSNPFFEAKIINIPDANTIVLAALLPQTIGAGDTFYILRHATQRIDDTGATIATVEQGPTQFVLDGVPTEVEIDTTTPANSRPFPVKSYDDNGDYLPLATEAKQDDAITELQSVNTNLAIIDASVQDVLTEVQAIRNNQFGASGSFAQATLTGTTEEVSTAPAKAIGFNIQAPSTNSDNIRFCVGSTASTSNGFLMEPGRSETIMIGAEISICATASTTSNEYIIQWILGA